MKSIRLYSNGGGGPIYRLSSSKVVLRELTAVYYGICSNINENFKHQIRSVVKNYTYDDDVTNFDGCYGLVTKLVT